MHCQMVGSLSCNTLPEADEDELKVYRMAQLELRLVLSSRRTGLDYGLPTKSTRRL